ncbi:MAG: bifunctional phosphopantothenoylcysteine decarboxylase/phosphopantothenate--cysteine ligase CoaBC, partial [Sporomusaceae bacterium]|nr:bifunctional phosphopantothenoylcysteine decarboxylase/phosphopantothenate--cysteine ligase CoaBC [Sporomusaceae bacterium]
VVQKNMATLKELGYHFISPGSGLLACGTEGVGRLAEPLEIVAFVQNFFAQKKPLLGKTILVTAAGTREAIDPVRYIGNRSSGKMGYAIAAQAVKQGAKVILVSGPSSLPQPDGVTFCSVESAKEMQQEVLKYFTTCDVVIKAAAVSDYRPVTVATHKIKKNDGNLIIELERNPDILRELGTIKEKQILVGFAAETQNVEAYAAKKLVEKNLDLIVANDVSQPGAGFNVDTNIAKLLFRDGAIVELPQMTKEALADQILDHVFTILQKSS